MVPLIYEENLNYCYFPPSLLGVGNFSKVTEIVRTYFDAMITSFIAFYNNLKDIDKTDIDNLLKNKSFDEAYKKELETMIGKLPDIED